LRNKKIYGLYYSSSDFVFEFHPNGGYLYMKFTIDMNDYSVSNPEFELVFPLNAQYKDPLMLKRKGTFLGFHDKYLYQAN